MKKNQFIIVTIFICLSLFFTNSYAIETNIWNDYQTPLFSGSYSQYYQIELPPGIRGLIPLLNLSYNSYLAKNKSGWVGAGWDIPHSYIQANPNGTFALFLSGVKHDLIDLTAIDGRYHTTIETYLKIQRKTGAANEKGEYWTVYDPNGTEYRFGYNPDSENMINATGASSVWRWSLDRVKDTSGNCIYYTYAENPTANDLGAVYLGRIEYNNEKKRLVEFILEETDRPDMASIVDQGSTVQEARRLAAIRVSVDGQLVKKISFQYALNTAGDTSLLSSVTKYGSDGTTALPPELFEYTAFVDGAGIRTDLLSKVTSTLGGITTIGYSQSSAALNTTLPENYWLVTSIAQANGMTGAHALSATSTLAYENGLYDAASQEFRGFGKVTETRPDGSQAVHVFHQDDALKGRLQNSTIFDAAGAPYSGTANVWTSSQANGVYKIYLTQTERYTYDGMPANPKTVRTAYGNFDDYGNARMEIDHGDLAVSGDETTSVKEFAYNPDLWIVNRVKHSTITAGVDGLGQKLREKWFYYDRAFSMDSPPFAGNLTKEVHWNNGGDNPVVQYKYDTYGNLTRKTDPLGNSSEIVYDSTYQTFPVYVYNAKGHVTTTVFNPVIGKPVSVTDPNGNTTTYAYDEFQRLTKIVKPGDSADFPTTEMQYVIGSAPPHLVIVKNRETAGGSTFDSVQAIDGLGKTIQAKSESDSSANMVVTDTYYDAMGREAKHSNAYFAAGSDLTYSTPDTGVLSTTTQYDVLGRPTRITHPDATFTTNSYSHWTVTQTDENGVVKSKTSDADNNLVQVVENNRGETYTTNYQYSLMSQLTAVIDHLGNTSTQEYDSLGRKIRAVDVDYGQKLFSYDLAGNLVSQTDARGITIRYLYDALNRQTLIDYPNDKDVQFVYDLETKGTLSRVYNNLGMDRYTYDARLRKTREDRTMDGQTWTTTYAYDSMDRLVSQTYPDGEIVQYSYNSRDKLASIQRGSQTLLSGLAYNAAGQLTQKTYGNSWITAYTYDADNLRLTNIATTKASATLQNLNYTHDPVGNVKTLGDAVAGRTETFDYDDLYRMVRAGDNLTTGGFDRSYVYNAVGNMTLETDNKTATEIRYSYGQGSAKPHAVTGKTSTDGLPIVGSLVVNKGAAYCTGAQVTLDNISMGVTPGTPTDFYMASEDKTFTGASWQPFSTSPSFALSTLPSDFKTSKDIIIYFKVKNVKGESQVKTAAIQWFSDVDGDGIPDINDSDNDNDGIPDDWETANGLNPFDPNDASRKPVGDELTYLQKYTYGLTPGTPDTDGDGWTDFYEMNTSKTNPKLADTDKDGIPDPTDKNPKNPYNDSFSANYSVRQWVFNAGGGVKTSANYQAADTLGSGFSKSALIDSDGDGIPDKWEIDHGLNPANAADAVVDADGDGLTNLQEYLYGTNPKVKDTDGDGWTDYQEVLIHQTNPTVKDTDNDGIADPQDPEPLKQTYVYAMSENYSVRNGGFNAGGGNRSSENHAIASDRIGGFIKDNIVHYQKFSIAPEMADFGSTEVNQSKTVSLTILNKGIDNLVIGTVSLSGGSYQEFSIASENCSQYILSPSGSCTIQVSFAPGSVGAKGTSLLIQYNDGEIKQADVPALGIAATETLKRLAVSRTGDGSGTVISQPAGIDCGATCTATYSSVTEVTLTATPGNGSVFAGWTGSGCTGIGVCTVAVDGEKAVAAEFVLLKGTITVNPDPDSLNAPWTLTGPDEYSLSGTGDQTISDLAAGDYTIAWGASGSWTKPSNETKTLASGGSITFAGNYQLTPVIPTPPTLGVVGSTITLTGSNFGDTQGSGYVDFNGVRGIIVSWSNTQIVVKIPGGAASGCMKVVTDYGTSECIDFTVSGILYTDFTGAGIWQYDGSNWSRLNVGETSKMTASGNNLYANFEGYGLWQWNGTQWSQLNPGLAANMTASGSNLYVDFAGYGLWVWNGTTWTQINTGNTNGMTASGNNVYANFSGYGLWQWNGSTWNQINSGEGTGMTASGTNLFANFTGYGIWQWNGSTWSQINTGNSTGMTASGANLYANFAGYGLWQWNGTTWTQLNAGNTTGMAATGGNLYANFAGYGLWKWDGSTWSQINTGEPAIMVGGE